MLSISLDDTKVNLKLKEVAEKVQDLRQPFDTIGTDLLQFFSGGVFENQGEPSGVRWRKLAPATLQMRAERRGHYAESPERVDMILWWTGTLRRGFQKIVEPIRLTIHNSVDYFKYHQARGGSHVPQRKMLTINKFVLTIITARMREFLEKIV